MRSARFIGFLLMPRDQILAADDEAGLRPAEQLVAGEGDEIGALGDRLRDRRLMREPEAGEIDQRAGAEIVDQRHLAAHAPAPRASRAATSLVKPSMR